MTTRDQRNPTCPCGYDLSGLSGPPWTCPECALITLVWPPPADDVGPPRLPQTFRLWLAAAFLPPVVLGLIVHENASSWVFIVYFPLVGTTFLGVIAVALQLAQRSSVQVSAGRWMLPVSGAANFIWFLILLTGVLLSAQALGNAAHMIRQLVFH